MTVPIDPRSSSVDVAFEERYWYPDDGGEVWVAGYQLVDADGRFLARDAPSLETAGLIVSGVAGAARHHADTLDTAGAAPGSALSLRRVPDNAHDPHAIAVLTRDGEQVGWVPRELAFVVAPRLDRGEPYAAVVLRERRASPRDPRTGLTMLLAPGAAIELRVH